MADEPRYAKDPRTPTMNKDDIWLVADTCQYSKSPKTRAAAERILKVLKEMYPNGR